LPFGHFFQLRCATGTLARAANGTAAAASCSAQHTSPPAQQPARRVHPKLPLL